MVYTFNLMKVFEDELIKIGIESSLSLLHMTWHQHPTSEQYRQRYRQAILLALKFKAKYWLTDSRQVPFIYMADQHWMYAKMRPLLKGGKLLKFAIVLQPDTLLMTDTETIRGYSDQSQNREKRFELEFFLDKETAQYWLWK